MGKAAITKLYDHHLFHPCVLALGLHVFLHNLRLAKNNFVLTFEYAYGSSDGYDRWKSRKSRFWSYLDDKNYLDMNKS